MGFKRHFNFILKQTPQYFDKKSPQEKITSLLKKLPCTLFERSEKQCVRK